MSIFSMSSGKGSSRRFSLGTVSATGALACLLAASPASAHPQGDDLDDVLADGAPSDRDVFLDGIELHPGVTADIHLRVLSNPRPGCSGKAIVAVPGAACSASTLVGLGEAILTASDDHDDGDRACRFIAVDLPAHGESPPPVGQLFGDLHFADYTAALLGTLDRLQQRGIETSTLMGHSLGGAVVLLAQQSLVDQGTNLRDAYGVDHLVGLAPGAWPRGIPCAICQNPQVGAALTQFLVVDPVLGPALELPAPVWVGLIFSRPDGTLATNAPSSAQVTALGFDSPESITVTEDDFGAPTPLDPGIFARDAGTKLDVISFQNDALVPFPEGEALYPYLTGQSPETGWTLVDGDNAVHGMPISDPAGMLSAVAGRVRFR